MKRYEHIELLGRAFAYGEIDAFVGCMNAECKYHSDYAHKHLNTAEQIEESMRSVYATVQKKTAEGENCTYSFEVVALADVLKDGVSLNDLRQRNLFEVSHDDAIEDKVIVIRGNVLRPEFRHASHQLMLCTGGFGAQKNARGRTCYCISLYSGKQTSFYRGDVLGVMDKRALPEWAKIGLQNALEIRQNEKSHPNERGEAR